MNTLTHHTLTHHTPYTQVPSPAPSPEVCRSSPCFLTSSAVPCPRPCLRRWW
jgi:hypothetical protein